MAPTVPVRLPAAASAPALRPGPFCMLPGRFVVPAASPQGFDFWLRHLLPAHGRRERMRRWLTLGLPPRARRLGLWLWRTEERTADSLPAVSRALAGLEASGALLASGLANGLEGSWVGRCDPPDEPRGRTVLFLLGHAGRTPVAVAKLQLQDGDRSLDGEWEALSRLHRMLPRTLAETLPRPLARLTVPGLEGILLSAGAGQPIDVAVQAARRPLRLADRHLRAALGWLADFQAATAGAAAGTPGARTEHTGPLRAVAGHGDFWPRNVLISRRGEVSAVVDWEGHRSAASPFEDLFQFTVHYALRLRDASARDRLEAFRLAFVADSPLAATIRRALVEWCGATGIDPEFLRPQLVAWLRRRAAGDDVRRRRPVPWSACLQMLEGSTW